MAINLNLYSINNTASKTLIVDFDANFLAASRTGVSTGVEYFFKFNVSGNYQDGRSVETKLNSGLSDLVLNGEKRRISNTASAYTDIKSMIVDYAFDCINGHDAGENGSSVDAQPPLDF